MTTAYDWEGATGDAWATEWRRTDRSLADLSRHLDAAILAAAPAGPFRALDIGCGAGGTSLALAAARPDAEIAGVDLSKGLVEAARERGATRSPPWKGGAGGGLRAPSELRVERNPPLTPPSQGGVSGRLDAPELQPASKRDEALDAVTFLTGDAITLAAHHASFDLLYSRHGVMFFDDSVAAFTALRRSANPAARLVFSCFRDWSLNAFACEIGQAIGASRPEPAAPGPFAFADRGRVSGILAAAGWRAVEAVPIDFAYRAGEGTDPVADALSLFQRIGPAAPVIRAAAPEDRPPILARLTTVIERHRAGNAIDFPAAAWIWSATA